MLDPFATATASLFSSSVAQSAVFTDSNSNQYTVRCVVQNKLSLSLQGYAAQVPENKTTITIIKSDIGTALDKDGYAVVEVDGKTYSVDGVVQEDPYTITLSILEV